MNTIIQNNISERKPETRTTHLAKASIPVRIVVKTILADTVTPVSLYLRLRDKFPGAVLLESADNAEGRNSRSFIAVRSVADVIGKDGHVTMSIPSCNFNSSIKADNDLPEILGEFIAAFDAKGSASSDVVTGLIGYTSYDAVTYFEDVKLADRGHTKEIPFLRYSLYRTLIEFDHLSHRLHIIEQLLPGDESDTSQIEAAIQQQSVPRFQFKIEEEENASMSEKDFLLITELAKKNCAAGNIFQVVLSRSFSRKFSGDEFNVYRALRAINPSPYLFFADCGDYRIFGSSPEAQLIITRNPKSETRIPQSATRIATVHPIAGTFLRTGDTEVDAKLEEQLLNDPKENSEHIMLVDLARNDLSRHATNVKVESFREVHRYSHVIHLVSKVTGELKEETNSFRLLADTFPAGTLSGAPKIKAMKIIDKYESTARGFYGGCIGLVGFDGTLNKAIMIRSFLSRNGELQYRAGAGVTINSNAENELQEINNKLGALRKAIASAEQITN